MGAHVWEIVRNQPGCRGSWDGARSVRMRLAGIALIGFVALLVASSMARAEPRPGQGTFAIVGATVHCVSGPDIERGVVLVENGRIAVVGPESAVTFPADTKQID